MANDPRDPFDVKPPGPASGSEGEHTDEAERKLDANLFRRRPRPLSGERPGRDDIETVSHIERVPRPEPVARIGPQRLAPPDETRRPDPWEAAPPRMEDPRRLPPPIREIPVLDLREPAGEPPRTPPLRAEPPRAEPPRAEPPRAPPPRPEPRAELPREATDEQRRSAYGRDLPRENTDEARGYLPREGTDEVTARPAPKEPRTWEEAGLDPVLGEQLALRYLVGVSTESARQVAQDLCLALPMVKDLLEQLKQAKLLQHRGSTAMGDFIYEVTEAGRTKAIDYKRMCAYVGPAPVPWSQYLQSVRDQALRSRSPTPDDLYRAFEDLVISDDLLDRLGPAVTSGRAMFLHGDPGNGKTSIAERITRCFGDDIWIPHALLIDGHLIKLYDPATHEAVEPTSRQANHADKLDRRWIKIKRPTVVAGGELTLEMLEIQVSSATNIGEAPLQLKANCGTLVIDDFGRQRIEPQVLLNRWIFPLERRTDFLRLPDGRKISAPFDPLLIFSTNLEPRDLVDEAFLRRIPYKIQVADPTEGEFIRLLETLAEKMDIRLAQGSAEWLVTHHYRDTGRHLRFCHPRDLLLQIVNQCAYERRPRVAMPQDFDRAVTNYFGAL
ncbi:MAG: hypothetical protein Q8P41_24445 [Pseudomonadota bacterium]|nr:hypothetical protein [Pseudomonadota bacterium]